MLQCSTGIIIINAFVLRLDCFFVKSNLLNVVAKFNSNDTFVKSFIHPDFLNRNEISSFFICIITVATVTRKSFLISAIISTHAIAQINYNCDINKLLSAASLSELIPRTFMTVNIKLSRENIVMNIRRLNCLSRHNEKFISPDKMTSFSVRQDGCGPKKSRYVRKAKLSE